MKLDTKFVKFILVGILNTIFGYCIFATLLFIGFHYTLAVILGTILGIIFNFKTTGLLVFNSTNNLIIFKFVLVYATICLLNIVLLTIAKYLNINLYLAGFVLTGIMAVMSFLLNKYWVFKNDEKD